MTLLLFALLVYGLCFLAADARIFGCDARGYTEIYEQEEISEVDKEWITKSGVLPIRQHLLKFRLFRELLSCYFCMGFWAGIGTHFYLRYYFQTDYILWHPDDTWWWCLGLGGAAVIGASVAYILDVVISVLENKAP